MHAWLFDYLRQWLSLPPSLTPPLSDSAPSIRSLKGQWDERVLLIASLEESVHQLQEKSQLRHQQLEQERDKAIEELRYTFRTERFTYMHNVQVATISNALKCSVPAKYSPFFTLLLAEYSLILIGNACTSMQDNLFLYTCTCIV